MIFELELMGGFKGFGSTGRGDGFGRWLGDGGWVSVRWNMGDGSVRWRGVTMWVLTDGWVVVW